MVDAAIKLIIYNEALSDFLGERKLNSLTESRKPRRVLDSIWDAGAMDYCLERANWNFAMRTVQADYSPSINPAFGYKYGFDKPTDWLRTSAICTDEYFNTTLLQYVDENGYWYSDVTPFYVRYVSKDDNYGYNLSLWTQAFRKYVASYLAFKGFKAITGGSANELQDLERQMKKAFYAAKTHDAIGEATSFPQTGSWVRARRGGISQTDRVGSSIAGG